MIDQFIQSAESLQSKGEWQGALASYDQALAFSPERGELHLARCKILRRLGRLDEAMTSIWLALGTGEKSADLWLEAASAQIGLNRLSEARATLRMAIEQEPGSGRAWALLGEALGKQDKDLAAEPCFRRSIALAPEDGKVRARLAQWLGKGGRYREALGELRLSLILAPGSIDSVASAAQILIGIGRLDEAESMLRRVLQRDAKHLDAGLGMARLALLRGDFDQGWPAYEWRRRRKDLKLPKMSGQEWDGSSLKGKTIAVYPEQGFGDVIQFLRYIKPLSEQADKVILLIPKELENLSRCMSPFAEIRSSLRDLPHYHFHAPLLSLPRYMGTLFGEGGPYIDIGAQRGKRIPVPEGTDLKVGLVWAGRPTHANDRQRSARLETFLPLTVIPGVTFYTLQAGPRAGDVAKEAHAALFGDLSPHLRDFVDTASVIEQLDLVIAVDTSVAHLAGALNKPVWVLIPYAPDWRWMLDREDTPWYPAMRLYRQKAPTSWGDVIERIEVDLRKVLEERRAGGRTEPDGSKRSKAKAHFQEGLKAQAAGNSSKALSEYALSATYDRSNPDLYNNLGVALQRLGRLAAAEAAYRRAAALRPGDAGTISNLGSVLRERGKLEEAVTVHEEAVRLAGEDNRRLLNAAHAALDLGLPRKAVELAVKAIERTPDSVDALGDRAAALLQLGEYDTGFAAYEAYLDRIDPLRKHKTPLWEGEALDGRIILLEVGKIADDALRFARYIPEMRNKGAGRVVVRCPADLVPLLRLVDQVDEVVANSGEAPVHDCRIRLASLPRAIGKVGRKPLQPVALKVGDEAANLRGSGVKLGIAWAPLSQRLGTASLTIPLQDLLPILCDPRLVPFSLQRGVTAGELKALGLDAYVVDLGPRISDLADAAKMLASMDLLVTTDTMLAQVAGTLGTPVLLLQGRAIKWQWMEREGRALWYPSVRVLRQDDAGRWAHFEDAVAEILKD